MRELFFKCIGAILVLYTGAAMGWRKGNAAMRRVQVLADICAFLGAVRDDLHFRCGRTEEILAAAQQNTRLSALPLYFSDLASGCGLQTELDNALCRTEREIAGVTRREERVLLRGALEGLAAVPRRRRNKGWPTPKHSWKPLWMLPERRLPSSAGCTGRWASRWAGLPRCCCCEPGGVPGSTLYVKKERSGK